jgi:hypothetical protein
MMHMFDTLPDINCRIKIIDQHVPWNDCKDHSLVEWELCLGDANTKLQLVLAPRVFAVQKNGSCLADCLDVYRIALLVPRGKNDHFIFSI